MGRLGTTDYNGHSPSITCHHLTTVHLPCTAGTVYSYASSVLGHLGPCQTREIQDMASLGQEGGPLWPIWPFLGREMRRRKGRQAGTEAYWYHCSFSMLDNSQGALSGPPKSVLECSSDLLLYYSHTFSDYGLLCTSSTSFPYLNILFLQKDL